MILFDFTNVQSVDDWWEVSDTVRTVGKSKAVLTLQTSQLFQRAVFFTLLNPQPNGAGFAGVRKRINIDLSGFKNIEITCRAQGQNNHYKICLRHRGQNSNMDLSYEQFFLVKSFKMNIPRFCMTIIVWRWFSGFGIVLVSLLYKCFVDIASSLHQGSRTTWYSSQKSSLGILITPRKHRTSYYLVFWKKKKKTFLLYFSELLPQNLRTLSSFTSKYS